MRDWNCLYSATVRFVDPQVPTLSLFCESNLESLMVETDQEMLGNELQLLRNMPVFGGLKTSSLETILSLAKDCKVDAGEYFFHEGDAACSLFVLRTGTVQVEKQAPSGCPVKIRPLTAGDCFGEMSLIDLQPRSASVIAETDCRAMEISLKTLHDLYASDLEQYAIIMMNMGREVSRRLRTVSDRLFELEQNAAD